MTHPSSGWLTHPMSHFLDTLPETNIAPENRPLEKEIPIGNHHFQGRTVCFREGSFLTPHWVTLMGNASFQPADRLNSHSMWNQTSLTNTWRLSGMFKRGWTTTNDPIGETKNPRDHPQGDQKGFTSLFPWGKNSNNKRRQLKWLHNS